MVIFHGYVSLPEGTLWLNEYEPPLHPLFILQDYNGGRSFAELQKFAQSLGPTCGPANLDLCDNEKKKLIDESLGIPCGPPHQLYIGTIYIII